MKPLARQHFIMRARVVGEDEACADCICGWHFSGPLRETNEAAQRHMKEKSRARGPASEFDSD